MTAVLAPPMTEDAILQYDLAPDYDPALAATLRDAWWLERGAPAWARRRPHTNKVDPERPLRIGYVSGDFRFHSAAMAFVAVILRHSEHYTAIAYNTAPPNTHDETTTFFKRKLGARLVDIAGYSAQALARIIRTDKIDILVDLSGLTALHRFETFAEKPAPIQLQGWGYVTDSGWPCFDGILADRFVAPLEMRESMQARVVDLPCVLTHDPRPDVHGISRQPCLEKPPVFGVFQRSVKFNPETCRVWSRLLTEVPDATLLIKSSQETPAFRARVMAAFNADVRSRIQFEEPNDHKLHLLRHHAVDLMLDTWPQSGGCSSLESLWMGVPILTMISGRMIQRTTGSFLSLLHLPQLIARDEDDYIAVAKHAVGRGKEQLAAIRATLRERFYASPIITGYVPAVERAYRRLWRDWCAVQQH